VDLKCFIPQTNYPLSLT